MSRDYAGEMRAMIDELTSQGPYIPAIVAGDIVEKLRQTDPELLTGWLYLQAISIVRRAINDRDHSARMHARSLASQKRFALAVQEFEDNNSSVALTKFLDTVYRVDDKGTRKRLAEMTADDLLYAANDYQDRAKQNAMQEAFLRALLDNFTIGTNDQVGEKFSEENIARLWNSISA